MKKIKIFILCSLLATASFSQQKAEFNLATSNVYVIMLDTVVKYSIQRYGGSLNMSCFMKGQIDNSHRIFDKYNGTIYSFSDTLVSGDAVQQGTSGVYYVTPHTSPQVTTKRNLFIMGTIFSYNTATQTLIPPSTAIEPIQIMTTSTGKISVTIYDDGHGWFDVLPQTPTVIGTIKKIVIN